MKSGENKTALITGIAGQDGSYLAPLLLQRGYKVIGLETPKANDRHIAPFKDQLTLISDPYLSYVNQLTDLLRQYQPDEIYHLAAQSSPRLAERKAAETKRTNIRGTTHLLEAIRRSGIPSRLYFASSAEIFVPPEEVPQKESTSFGHPTSLYGTSKLLAHLAAHAYRQEFGMFVSCGITYNHESPHRGFNFVTSKVALGAACASLGIKETPELRSETREPVVKNGKIRLDGLESRRDWGYAPDYVQAMWLILQQAQPADYILATGETHSLRELCHLAFSFVGLNYEHFVEINPHLVRPIEKKQLVGDASKAQREFGWKPTKPFGEIVAEMVNHYITVLGGGRLNKN